MAERAPHIPVLLRPLLQACAPVTGRWLDGTFGQGAIRGASWPPVPIW